MGLKTLGPIQGPYAYKALTAATTLGIKDLNKIFDLDADGQAISFPAASTVESGTWLKVILTVDASGSWTITSGADDIEGGLAVATADDLGASTAAGPMNTIIFVTGQALAGAYVELVAVGAFWHIMGWEHQAEDITLTDV